MNRLAALQQGDFVEGESFLRGKVQIPISVQGVSVVQVKNGKISPWFDYYDSRNSRRYSIAFWFAEWIEA